MSKHEISAGKLPCLTTRWIVFRELRLRDARRRIEGRAYSPWAEPLVGRHRAGEEPSPLRENAAG